MSCVTASVPVRIAWGVLGLTALAVLGGCAGSGPADTQPEAVEHVEDTPDLPEVTVTPRPGMLDVEPVRIWHAYGTVDERTLWVTFPSQGPPCEVLDRVEVDETETRLTVTLLQGRDPDVDPPDRCDGPADGVFEVEVPLSRPFEFEVDVLLNGGSLTDRTEIEALVSPQPGMVDVEPVRWWYDYGRDLEHELLVTFASLGPPCEVLDRVEVDETASPAVITLYQGRDPDADPDVRCDGPTQVVGVEVPLAREHLPTDRSPYILAGITAETGEGPIVNGGSLTDRP